MVFPVCFNPVSQGGPIHPEFTGDLGDRAGSLYHHPGGFLLELWREVTALFSWHSIPSFPVKILLDPRPESSGTPELLMERDPGSGALQRACLTPRGGSVVYLLALA